MTSDRTRIDKLLRADAANAELSPELLRNLHPWAFDAIRETEEMYRFIIRRLHPWAPEERLQAALERLARNAGLSNEELAARLMAGRAGDIAGAPEAYRSLGIFRILRIVLLACQRYWAWGISDLLRMRITGAHGYLRLQAECVGLIELFLRDPNLAERWFSIRTERDGKQFFGDTQRQLRDVLGPRQLLKVYDIASSSALHVRMAGLSRALSFEPGAMTLPDQEFDPEDPYSYHLAASHYHVTQVRVLKALGEVLPEMANDEWRTRLNTFIRNAQDMWRTLEQRYAPEVRAQEPAEPPPANANG
jgi:hypothetical protein